MRDEGEDEEFDDFNALYRTVSLEDKDATKIRLLRIAKSERVDDPLELTFNVVSLSDDAEVPEYVALSYTWRAPHAEDEVLHEITFSDRYRKKITRNLLLAMRMLRHLGHVTVWIDQLSINQEDLGERGEQVRSMAKIYSRASKVVIYLGEENETSLAALRCLPEALRFIHQCREAEAEGRDPKSIPGLRLGRDALEAWMGIYDYPWFKRVWVVQETLLAKQASFVVGLNEYDGLPLRHSHHFLSSGVDHMPKTELSRKQDAFRTRSRVLGAWAWMTRAYDQQQQQQQQSGSVYYGSKSLEAMDWMRAFGATDDRDRIFAMLEPLRLDAVPDYKASVPTVYTRFAISHVLKGLDSALEVVEAAGRHNQKHPDLPSWVPDWTAPRRYRITWSPVTPLRLPFVGDFFKAVGESIIDQIDHVAHNPVAGTLFLDSVQATNQRPRVGYRLNLFELAIKGATVGRIASIAPALTKQQDDAAHVRAILAWHRDTRRLAYTTHTHRYPDPLDRVDAFTRLAALAFNLVNKHPTTASYLRHLELLEKYDAPGGPPMTGPDWGATTETRIMELVPQEHRICFTHEGHLALVPEASRPGDYIAVLPSYKYAVVLTALEHGRFTYIGGAHVLDVVDGRCRLEPQKFILR